MRKIIMLVAAMLLLTTANAQRKTYPGSHHTESHGGTYQGGSGGSSHKGGHYKNPDGGHTYGKHKK